LYFHEQINDVHDDDVSLTHSTRKTTYNLFVELVICCTAFITLRQGGVYAIAAVCLSVCRSASRIRPTAKSNQPISSKLGVMISLPLERTD